MVLVVVMQRNAAMVVVIFLLGLLLLLVRIGHNIVFIVVFNIQRTAARSDARPAAPPAAAPAPFAEDCDSLLRMREHVRPMAMWLRASSGCRIARQELRALLKELHETLHHYLRGAGVRADVCPSAVQADAACRGGCQPANDSIGCCRRASGRTSWWPQP